MSARTILLVDDDADFLRVLRNRCEEIGFNVQQTCNLLGATLMIEKRVPDVICVDVQMPTGNGLAFCESLAADRATANVPIIVLTGESGLEVREACRRLRAQFIHKTVDYWSALEPVLRRLAAEAKSQAESMAPEPSPRQQRQRLLPPLRRLTVPPFPRDRSTKQILVADDDDDIIQMLSQRCGLLGCSVIGVTNALDAINVIHRVRPDLVCLDVGMPSGNGLCVCEMMVSDEELRNIPIIVLTGRGDESTIRRCHEMLVYYVQKSADTWRRIEPLLRELLHLDEAVADPRITSNRAAAALEPGGNPSSSGEHQDLVDAVFAVLGVGSDQVAERDEVPWILCIDDDADFSDALKIRLEEHGVAVVRAFNGMEGYRMAFTSPASAILLDYNMPNGQGDYILSRLKDNPVTKHIPVVIITGTRDKMLERRMLAMGATAFFEKPVNFDALRNHRANYINILGKRKRAHAEQAV